MSIARQQVRGRAARLHEERARRAEEGGDRIARAGPSSHIEAAVAPAEAYVSRLRLAAHERTERAELLGGQHEPCVPASNRDTDLEGSRFAPNASKEDGGGPVWAGICAHPPSNAHMHRHASPTRARPTGEVAMCLMDVVIFMMRYAVAG